MSEEYIAKAYDNFVVYEKLYHDDGVVILMDGEEIRDKTKAYFFDFYQWALVPTWIDQETTPYMYVGVKGFIPQLELRNYDEDTVKMLNKQGLNIYLYEVLTFGLGELVRNTDFHHPDRDAAISATVVKHCGHNMIFDCSIDKYDDLYCYEFDSISKFAERNGLTNVNVYCCHYNVKKYFQHKYSNINLYCKDLHLATMVHYPPEEQFPIFKIENPSTLIEKKFVCPNWRYHTARHLVMSYLVDKSGYYSWYFNGDQETLQKNLWFDIDSWKDKYPKEHATLVNGIRLLDQKSPLKINIDQPSTDINGKIDYWKFPGNYTCGSPGDYRMDDVYLKTFCVVVTESTYAQPVGIFSEKVMNAIKLGRPFVMVAPPHTLEYMRKQGFQTFGRFWDETYDDDEDHETRMLKIMRVLDFINDKDINELRVMYSNMQDILENNARMLETLKTKQWVFD